MHHRDPRVSPEHVEPTHPSANHEQHHQGPNYLGRPIECLELPDPAFGLVCDMHQMFQDFIDDLLVSSDEAAFSKAMSRAAATLELSCFAYLCLPHRRLDQARLISSYPLPWTSHYLNSHYERVDPVIKQALQATEPFEWGSAFSSGALSDAQHQLFEEAATFGIRYGFTIPIHDGRGPVAAVTFAADERSPTFQRCIVAHHHVLQLMALYFHANARRKLCSNRIVDGVALSPREYECLEWSAAGKSAWEIGRILGITRRTAAFHLDNARRKLGVSSLRQAIARLAASNHA